MREDIRRIQELMEGEGYVTDRAVATSVYLATTLGKPLLVEGHPGVGKTDIAKVLAKVLDGDLIRLQCYEGLDANTALYEWNYPKQLLHIKLDERSERPVGEREADIFSEAFLLKRPLLQAITHQGRPPVLLIDEVDRADEEFEAFSVGGALRLPSEHPRGGDGARQDAPLGGAHLQPLPGPLRRPAPSVSLPVD